MAFSQRRAAAVPDVVSHLVDDLSDLVRKESALVRAEISEKLSRVVQGAVGVALAAVLLLGAFFTLLAAIVLALTLLVAPIWACLITTGLLLALGGVAAMVAMRRVRPQTLTPVRSLREAEKIADIARGDR